MARLLVVGLRSGAARAALELGHEVVLWAPRRPGPRLRERLSGVVTAPLAGPGEELPAGVAAMARPDAVLATGEEAVLAAALAREHFGVPGHGVGVARRCRDKALMKSAVRAAGVQCADWVTDEDGLDARGLLERLGLPLVVKQRAGGGSRGTRVLRHAGELPDRLPAGWMAERMLRGTEMSLECLVQGGRVVWSNPTQYLVPAWANVVPAPLAAAEHGFLLELHALVVAALGIERGMTHLECFVQEDGRAVFGEIAIRPPGGHILPLVQRSYGFDPWAAVVRLELGEDPGPLPARAGLSSGVWLLHPGRGRVERIRGLDEARALPGVVQLSLRVQEGDDVDHRAGTGQEAGHIVVEGPDAGTVANRLRAAVEAFDIELEASPEGHA